MEEKTLKAIEAAAEKAGFGRLYFYEVRHGSGIVDWDLSTCESDDPEAPDCESIARVYNQRDIAYFVEMTPERATEMIAEVRRLRAELERQAAEIAALQLQLATANTVMEQSRRVMDDVREYVQAHKVGRGGDDVVRILLDDAVRLRVVVDGLLDTKGPMFVMGFGKPDAAPVEIRGEMCGCGSRNTANTEGSTWWFKCEDCGFVFDAAGSRATLVEAWRAWKAQSEPVEPPAREIAVGDSVRVTLEGIRKGHVGTVTRLPEDNYGAYEVKLVHLSDIFETALLDYSRDEIEPA